MKIIFGSLLLIFVFVLISCSKSGKSNKNKNSTTITAQELKELYDKDNNIKIIDVRSEKEFYGNIGHIQGSDLIPLQTIAKAIKDLKQVDGDVYVVCLSGKRSGIAARVLRSNGINALNLEGGMLAWNKLP